VQTSGPAVAADLDRSWPALPWREWTDTVSTLHMWVQIVGKVRMALAPPLNHWWHITLYVTSRGLTTSPIPYQGRAFQVDFDFIDHRLDVTESSGRSFTMMLEPISVATFYREFMARLRELGIDVRIWPRPVEVPDAIPFDVDETHATYDPLHAHAVWRGLQDADRVLKSFQTGFIGKASPVHFFWGGFDLATTRYSGRLAPRHPGGILNCPDWVMAESYSREEASMGWWPWDRRHGPAFYAYTYPEPAGYASASVQPERAVYDPGLREFILPYGALRNSDDPEGSVQAFLRSAYEAGADLGGWDRSMLEPAVPPDRPPARPWSLPPR
jgi:hypothetical protein